MADSLFTITTTPPSSLELEIGQTGKFSFTVTSLAAPDKSQDLILQALLVGPEGKKEVDWLAPGPQRTLTMVGGETETVTITVRPNSKSPLGDNRIELAIADKEATNDVYVYSSPVTCKVLAMPGPTPEPKKPLPKWLIPVIIAGVVVLGGAAFAIWKFVIDKAPGLNEVCKIDDKEPCRDNLVCSPDKNKCLLPGGAECSENTTCDSGECVTKLGVCAVRTGASCDLAALDRVPCPTNTHCDPDSKTCLENVCKAGDHQCTGDGKSLSTCQDNGTWKTEPCPATAPVCRDGTCQCDANRGKTCNCSGTVQCDGTCSAAPCASSCINGQCCSPSAGAACGKCGGVIKCDGTCSVPTPPNLGLSCGQCGGKIQCNGSCSPPTPPNFGQSCGECGGKILCNGACSNTLPRCPAGFIVDPITPGQCRSKTPVQVRHEAVSIPGGFGACPLNLEKTLSQACGTGRVQSSVVVKNVSGGTGRCDGKFATSVLTDCSIRWQAVQPAIVCTPFKCDITINAVQRRAQCTN